MDGGPKPRVLPRPQSGGGSAAHPHFLTFFHSASPFPPWPRGPLGQTLRSEEVPSPHFYGVHGPRVWGRGIGLGRVSTAIHFDLLLICLGDASCRVD